MFQSVIWQLKNHLISWPRATKQALMVAVDLVGLSVCLVAAAWLLLPSALGDSGYWLLSALAIASTMLMAAQHGFYQAVVRYVGSELAMTGVKVAILGGGMAALGASIWQVGIDPLRLAAVFSVLCLLFMLGSRYTARSLLNRRQSGRESVIIYGAGDAGARLLMALQHNDRFLPVALVDDKESMRGQRVNGLRVHDSGQLAELIESHSATRVLLALPSASRRRRKAIITKLEKLSVHVQTIPDFNDLVSGSARVDDLHDVDVADLLGRDPVQPDTELLSGSISGKAVMITGAGGSIGSELCAQIVELAPRVLVLFELSEIALYTAEKRLRKMATEKGLEIEVVSLLGSVTDRERVAAIVRAYGVDTLYHAAAYKHVPVVEQNMLEGARNNILGTLHTAKAAAEGGVSTFVLISTDKAVSPTNVMGATKRFAELILQAMQEKYPDTTFCMVRFGNVLESSGSVVPLFREQIRAGGPVTVTHRDIIRYFMTIPEAAQLVIQAASLARGGDVFVLDMGEPVRILDLARRMIHLMGLTVRDDSDPDGDIEIEFSGLRPAEKLYEELLIGGEVYGTRHRRIMRAREEFIDIEHLNPMIENIRRRLADEDCGGVRSTLLDAVSGYRPTNDIDDLVWRRARQAEEGPRSATVVDLTQRPA